MNRDFICSGRKKSDRHPWINALKKHNTELINLLVHMAYDVYNDCLIETVSANSWPSRSLTNLASGRLVSLMKDEGCDFILPPYTPSAADLHYRDPVYYRQMLASINEIEMKNLSKKFDDCLVFSIQIDGSVSKKMEDNKFVSCTMAQRDGTISTLFMTVASPEQSGAKGLQEAVNSALDICGANRDKLSGITTDGEAASTGKKSGLWRLLIDQFERELLTFWCCAHRSDLAVESIIVSVPELKIWKVNVVGLATYFRTSSKRTKSLRNFCADSRQFPRHHEIRFAEHMLQLIDAVLYNIAPCIEVFKVIEESGDKRDKAEARGYLHVWNDKQIWMTELMGDILEVFKVLQQQLQRDLLFISDILTCRDGALRKLQLMKSTPYPGKRESKSKYEMMKEPTPVKAHTFIPSMKRNAVAIRNEIILSAENFLSERLNVEQEAVIASLKELLTTRSMNKFTEIACSLSARLYPASEGALVDEICEQWPQIEAVPWLPDTSDRIVSHRNIMIDDTQTCTSLDTINCKLNIALNGVGTAYYDPRPAVLHFLSIRE